MNAKINFLLIQAQTEKPFYLKSGKYKNIKQYQIKF